MNKNKNSNFKSLIRFEIHIYSGKNFGENRNENQFFNTNKTF